MEFNIIPDKDALAKCANCQNQINDEAEVFCIGAQLKPDTDLSGYQSHCIEIELDDGKRTVCMMVTARNSEASLEGNDGMFMTCSAECRQQLKTALKKDTHFGNLFESVTDTQL